jgi:hypothetical protein
MFLTVKPEVLGYLDGGVGKGETVVLEGLDLDLVGGIDVFGGAFPVPTKPDVLPATAGPAVRW